jgi:hypothetical protein
VLIPNPPIEGPVGGAAPPSAGGIRLRRSALVGAALGAVLFAASAGALGPAGDAGDATERRRVDRVRAAQPAAGADQSRARRRRAPRSAGKGGLANLTASLVTEGTATRSAQQIKDQIDFLGAALGADADQDYATVSLQVLRKDLDTGLDLLADVLLRPAFHTDELARQREGVLATLRSQEDDPTTVAQKAFQRTLFGDTPYGHAVEGTTDRLGGDDHRADVEHFYANYFRPGGGAIVVVGDVSADELRPALTRALGTWDGPPAPPFVYPPFTPPPAHDRPHRSSRHAGGHRHRRSRRRARQPDYETLQVMNYILGGGGFSSRLMDNIRTKAGLAYSVGSFFAAGKSPGPFEIVMQTKNASVATRSRAPARKLSTSAPRRSPTTSCRKRGAISPAAIRCASTATPRSPTSSPDVVLRPRSELRRRLHRARQRRDRRRRPARRPRVPAPRALHRGGGHRRPRRRPPRPRALSPQWGGRGSSAHDAPTSAEADGGGGTRDDRRARGVLPHSSRSRDRRGTCGHFGGGRTEDRDPARTDRVAERSCDRASKGIRLPQGVYVLEAEDADYCISARSAPIEMRTLKDGQPVEGPDIPGGLALAKPTFPTTSPAAYSTSTPLTRCW